MKKRVIRWILWALLALVILFAIQTARNWDVIRRTMLGGLHVYETTPPPLPATIARPAILVFSKTNAFRHEEAIPVANRLFAQMAKDNHWGYYQTENGATFDPAILSRFDAVIFNNASGDVFTPAQQQALRNFVEKGGSFVGIHAAGDSSSGWRWYDEHLIGAHFIGHPLNPQFQKATVIVEDKAHPVTQGLPASWQRVDEWYSFEKAPRRPGFHVLMTLDERSYANHKLMGKDLSMGADHPIAWWHCTGKGRVLYSAMGHQASAYAEPAHVRMLRNVVDWALNGKECAAPSGNAAAENQGTKP